MTPFTTLTSIAAVLPDANVDTDIILPARFLLITEKWGLGHHAFHDRRYDAEGRARADFPLNERRFQGAEILIAGENFGSGSSREHAPWALADLGFRCIVAPSFGEIFAANCVKNGMLPLALPAEAVAALATEAEAGRPITVDLVEQRIGADDLAIDFAFPEARRQALLNGWDEIAMIEAAHGAAIGAFEAAQRAVQPWLWRESDG